MRILTIGPLWRGSNAGGLFRALSRQGCLIEIVDEFYYISLQTKSKLNKVLERPIRQLQINEFNNAIKHRIELFKPTVLLVYKGAFVLPETLIYAKNKSCLLTLFYPDVSMTAHGPNIPRCLPIYNLVFTTKTFGIKDMNHQFGVKNAYFIPHGFDPEIHRKLNISSDEQRYFNCDASFIGTWSPKKENWLSHLVQKMPELNFKIWGDQWFKATSEILRKNIQHTAVLGDLYAVAIQCSLINLGILSEKVAGSSSGDLITSRTFHIPGSSGFMLHERNEESILYYKEDSEAGFFEGKEEMADKVAYYLQNPETRNRIQVEGYHRALREHSLDQRAKTVLELIGYHQKFA